MASVEEEYIDMDLGSSSSPRTRDFEFKMPEQSVTAPADELFYKGKLLPLLLSSRRLLVENLLRPEVPTELYEEEEEEDCCSFTPLDSCIISPSDSCRVSCEMNPEDFLEWSTEESSFIIADPPKKAWWRSSKTVKLIKRLVAGKKLKSWFIKSGCSNETPVAAENGQSGKLQKIPKDRGFGKVLNYSSLASMIKILDKDGDAEETIPHRRSFSGAIKRLPATAKSPSSSCSSSESSIHSNEPRPLRRSSSATDIESSIEAAIAHCKRSQT